MARPRIFISSTYYDLKYIRASLDLFIDSLGFEPVLSEKGDIAYTSDRPLDESCYREVENADVFILIVGGRYGSEISAGSKKPDKTFFDRYESITKKEFASAAEKDIPLYVLIEKGVHAEYQTFIRNRELTTIKYAHVDSVNVFLLIEDILSKPRNNPVHTFEKFEDIQVWLREQWAGLFRELLRRQSQQQQLSSLSAQILQLKETNETLKKYLEAVMQGAGKQETSRLIEREEERLKRVERLARAKKNDWVQHVVRMSGVGPDEVCSAIANANSFENFGEQLNKLSPPRDHDFVDLLRSNDAARIDFNKARTLLGLPGFETPEEWTRPSDTFGEPQRRNRLPSRPRLDLGDMERPIASSGTQTPSVSPAPVAKKQSKRSKKSDSMANPGIK